MTTAERTESSQRNLAIKNMANLDFNNDSYHVVGYVARQYPADVVNQSIDISLIGNDNIENSYARDAADLCYNRHLLYDGYKDMSMVGRFNKGADSFNHTAIRNVSAKTLARQASVSAYQSASKASGKTHSIEKLLQISNDEENKLTAYYIKEQKFAARPKKQHYSDLLSLSLSDMAIEMLEKKQDCNDMAIINNTRSDATTNLSREWSRFKRPQASGKLSTTYDNEGKEIDPIELLSVNHVIDSPFHKSVVKLLKGDLIKVYDMVMAGHSQAEIAVALNKSERTIDSLWNKVKTMLKPVASELSDYVTLKNSLPVYALADNNRVWADNVRLSDKLPGKVKHIAI